MKQTVNTMMALAVLALVSCAKVENEVVETPAETPAVQAHVIHAMIDDSDATKTTYEEGAETSAFSWVQNDEIKMVVYTASDNSANYYRYRAQASASKADLVLQGTADFEEYPLAGFAVYSSDLTIGGTKDNYTVTLPASYTVSGTDFSAVKVPLIGMPKSELEPDSYVFKTAVGVLKVTFGNVPSVARKVVLTSSADNLSGVFALNATSAANGLLMTAASEAGHSISVNFPEQEAGSTISVYIPVPVGTISAGATLSLQTSDGTSIITTSPTTQEINIQRAHLTPIAGSINVPASSWVSLGNGKFIDTYVWGDKDWGVTPVSVEFFYDSSVPGAYRMANPYAAAAAEHSVATTVPDEFFYFTMGEKGRVLYQWVNMGFPLSKNVEKNWAMIDGYSVAGYANGYARSHVVSYAADGSINNIQLAPCYRTSDENKTGGPSSYDNEIGQDSKNGIIEIAFPGKDILMPVTIPSERIKVSANHTGDGTGAAGLIDDALDTYWHTPWSSTYPSNPDATYGQYVTVKLPEQLTSAAFNYCTRQHSNQDGAPATVVVGGTKDGATWTVLGIFDYAYLTDVTSATWVGLPVLTGLEDYIALRFGVAVNKGGYDLRDITDPGTQWCNLGELKVYGVSTGVALPLYPELEAGQVWVQANQITVNSDCSKYDGTGIWNGNGYASLVDESLETFWHSSWQSGYTGYYDPTIDFDTTYGITIDIALTSPLKDFHLSYYVRADNNNGEPRAILFAGSNDGANWTDIATVENDTLMKVAKGSRVDLPTIHATTTYSHLRIGIIKAGNGDTANNLCAGGNSTAIAELLLFAD